MHHKLQQELHLFPEGCPGDACNLSSSGKKVKLKQKKVTIVYFADVSFKFLLNEVVSEGLYIAETPEDRVHVACVFWSREWGENERKILLMKKFLRNYAYKCDFSTQH